MSRIKLCGMTDERDIGYANAAAPDYVGFVFAPGRHCVSERTAAGLRSLLDPRIKSVGVFVDAEIPRIVSAVEKHIVSLVQLHGAEDAAYLKVLRRYVSVPVIKAYHVGAVPLPASALSFPSDYLLLDGGSGAKGKTFDWSIAGTVGRPFFLAGGLTPENLGRAIAAVRPFAVDISSGTERNGKKDLRLMQKAVAIAHGLS